MLKRVTYAALTVAYVLAVPCLADELSLKNGDTLRGRLVSSKHDKITWASDILGDIKVPADQVVAINGVPHTPPPKPPVIFETTYKGSLSLTGSFASGNEEREDWDFDSAVGWRSSEKLRHASSITYESHSQNGAPQDEEAEVNYDVDYFFRDQWYWSNAVAWGFSEPRSLDQYYSVGTALGYQFWEEADTALSAETGFIWLSEEFEDGKNNDGIQWRWAADYHTRLFNKIDVFHTHQILVSTEDAKDSEIKADIGLRTGLIENLFAEIKMEWVYDNQPGDDAEHTDSQLTFGVNYSW